jgi:hypothetical protein
MFDTIPAAIELPVTKTTGIVVVAAFSARAGGGLPAPGCACAERGGEDAEDERDRDQHRGDSPSAVAPSQRHRSAAHTSAASLVSPHGVHTVVTCV